MFQYVDQFIWNDCYKCSFSALFNEAWTKSMTIVLCNISVCCERNVEQGIIACMLDKKETAITVKFRFLFKKDSYYLFTI